MGVACVSWLPIVILTSNNSLLSVAALGRRKFTFTLTRLDFSHELQIHFESNATLLVGTRVSALGFKIFELGSESKKMPSVFQRVWCCCNHLEFQRN